MSMGGNFSARSGIYYVKDGYYFEQCEHCKGLGGNRIARVIFLSKEKIKEWQALDKEFAKQGKPHDTIFNIVMWGMLAATIAGSLIAYQYFGFFESSRNFLNILPILFSPYLVIVLGLLAVLRLEETPLKKAQNLRKREILKEVGWRTVNPKSVVVQGDELYHWHEYILVANESQAKAA